MIQVLRNRGCVPRRPSPLPFFLTCICGFCSKTGARAAGGAPIRRFQAVSKSVIQQKTNSGASHYLFFQGRGWRPPFKFAPRGNCPYCPSLKNATNSTSRELYCIIHFLKCIGLVKDQVFSVLTNNNLKPLLTKQSVTFKPQGSTFWNCYAGVRKIRGYISWFCQTTIALCRIQTCHMN